jgi:hypothetical protein
MVRHLYGVCKPWIDLRRGAGHGFGDPPPATRLGKFQGQDAAVCVFSMATSSGEEIRRHVEFCSAGIV